VKSIFPTQPRSERRRFHENPCICAGNLSRRWTRCSVGGKPEVCTPSNRVECREDRHGLPQTKPWQPASEMLIKRRRGVSHSNLCRPADRKSRSVKQARTPVPREIRRERREGECLVGRNATARFRPDATRADIGWNSRGEEKTELDRNFSNARSGDTTTPGRAAKHKIRRASPTGSPGN